MRRLGRCYSTMDNYKAMMERHAYGIVAPRLLLSTMEGMKEPMMNSLEYHFDSLILKYNLRKYNAMIEHAEHIKSKHSDTILPKCINFLMQGALIPKKINEMLPEFIKLTPNSQIESVYKVYVLGLHSKYDEAITQINAMPKTQIQSSLLQYKLYQYTAVSKSIATAENIYKQYFTQTTAPIWDYYKSIAYALTDQNKQVEHIKAVVHNYEKSNSLIAAQMYVDISKPFMPISTIDDKIKYLEKANSICPEIGADREMLGLYFVGNQLDKLEKHWDSIKHKYPSENDIELTILEANIEWHVKGNYRKAKECYQRAKQMQPSEAKYYDNQISNLNKRIN